MRVFENPQTTRAPAIDGSAESSKLMAEQAPRGAWIVEALIVALVLLLVGRSLGVAITLTAFMVAVAIGMLLTLATHFLVKLLRGTK